MLLVRRFSVLWFRSNVRIGWEVAERKRIEFDVISIGNAVGAVSMPGGGWSVGMPR